MRLLFGFYGGDVCESNTPETFCVSRNGFEGRGAHQEPIRLRSNRQRVRKPTVADCTAIGA